MATVPITREEPQRRISPRLNPGAHFQAPPATPNSDRMPFNGLTICISQEFINYSTDKVLGLVDNVWTPPDILIKEAIVRH